MSLIRALWNDSAIALLIPDYYLAQNPDVAEAVAKGEFASGFAHLIMYAISEGRIRGVIPGFAFRFVITSESQTLTANLFGLLL
ncbi:hypothetical protein [Laspinema olomoucense]|uniref:Uncharacterized protein n=1 Tax=Laspinema olomoucense D3b TaxID=2953688 RepID=A0ABT2NAV6_9CYAN|nr:hypothetical protein [Laspinema sp. D3b]MCT7979840.1 hypothetical protein [Laspinema sp. D3b]